jgi:hypothetical protein
MIPSPNLDDRSFDDIVEEAVRLIPQYCPTWTNFNKADPGITLLGAVRVDDRDGHLPAQPRAGQELPGLPEHAGAGAEPAAAGARDRALRHQRQGGPRPHPAGTRLTTKPADDQPPLLFETEQEVLATSNKLVRCMSQYNQMFSDNTPFVSGLGGAFEVFGGARSIERYIYFGDARFAAFSEDAILFARFEQQSAGEREFPDLLEWEYWDGSRWRELVRPPMEQERNTVAFYGPALVRAHRGQRESSRGGSAAASSSCRTPRRRPCWTSSRRGWRSSAMACAPSWPSRTQKAVCSSRWTWTRTSSPSARRRRSTARCTWRRRRCWGSPRPASGSTWSSATRPSPRRRARRRTSCCAGSTSTASAGRCSGAARRPTTASRPSTSSSTGRAASRSRARSASCVRRTSRAQKRGAPKALYVRCRIELGRLSARRAATSWMTRRGSGKTTTRCARPSSRRLVFKFQEQAHVVEHCLVYNDFLYVDHSKVAATEYKPFQVFQPATEESPTLFLGWEAPFPNENVPDLLQRG